MKLYRTRTQEEYDWLMQKLEDEGYEWAGGAKPTQGEDARTYADETVVYAGEDGYLVWDFVRDVESKDLNKITEVSDLMKDHPLTTKVEERNNKPSRQVELDNSKANRHERLMNHLNEVYRVKNKDYGDAFGKSHEKYGAIAGLTRINDKFNRLEELILSGEQLVEDETVLDTLLDLANYSIMLYMELEK